MIHLHASSYLLRGLEQSDILVIAFPAYSWALQHRVCNALKCIRRHHKRERLENFDRPIKVEPSRTTQTSGTPSSENSKTTLGILKVWDCYSRGR